MSQFQKPKLRITAFVPTNEAYQKLLKSIGYSRALSDDKTVIKRVLGYHILNQPVLAKEFDLGLSKWPTALPGAEIRVTKDDDGVLRIGPYRVVRSDVLGGRSVMHLIDGVLISPEMVPALMQATRAAAAEPAGAR